MRGEIEQRKRDRGREGLYQSTRTHADRRSPDRHHHSSRRDHNRDRYPFIAIVELADSSSTTHFFTRLHCFCILCTFRISVEEQKAAIALSDAEQPGVSTALEKVKLADPTSHPMCNNWKLGPRSEERPQDRGKSQRRDLRVVWNAAQVLEQP